MIATITDKLEVGDIIEIIRHDDRCRMNLRRVRIVSVRTRGDYHTVVASNLHGENAWDYVLPRESWSEIVRKPNNAGWFPFVEDVEFDG